MNSQATIGSLDNDDLTFNIMGQTGLGNLSAIMANDYGVNEINAKSINMQNSLSDSRNHSQEEQNIFEVLTVDIDTAADKYAKVVDDYGKYASQADYFQALDTAKKSCRMLSMLIIGIQMRFRRIVSLLIYMVKMIST